MPDDALVKYVREQLAAGRTEEILRPLLIRAGWHQSDVDEAFRVIHGGAVPAQPIQSVLSAQAPLQTSPQTPAQASASVQPQPQPQAAPTEPTQPVQPAPRRSRAVVWIAAIVIALAAIGGGAWAAYAYFTPPSPQQVLDAMFQKGITGILSMNNDVQASADITIVPATTTPPDLIPSSPMQSSLGPAEGFSSGFLGKPTEIKVQFESSGTMATAPDQSRESDQVMSFTAGAVQVGQEFAFSGNGEVRSLDDAMYINIATLPDLGLFDFTPFENRWIEIPFTTSTSAMAQGFTGTPFPALATTTLSAADQQKLVKAGEEMVSITQTFPNTLIGGSPVYHYAYTLSPTGTKDFAHTLLSVAADLSSSTASTSLDDASATAAVDSQIDNFFSSFTSIGGELWIGKSDYYPHQVTLTMSFSTSTATIGSVSGSVDVTSTITDINGDQSVAAPQGAVDITTLLQSLFSPGAMPQSTTRVL